MSIEEIIQKHPTAKFTKTEVFALPGMQFMVGNHLCTVLSVGITGCSCWSMALGEFIHSNTVNLNSMR